MENTHVVTVDGVDYDFSKLDEKSKENISLSKDMLDRNVCTYGFFAREVWDIVENNADVTIIDAVDRYFTFNGIKYDRTKLDRTTAYFIRKLKRNLTEHHRADE